MNANELADELANVGWNKPFLNWELLDETATMLRQQQAEIEALKSVILALDSSIDNAKACMRMSAEELMELYK